MRKGRKRSIRFEGTVGAFRAQILPVLRKAGMKGLTLGRSAVRIQARIDRFAPVRGDEAA